MSGMSGMSGMMDGWADSFPPTFDLAMEPMGAEIGVDLSGATGVVWVRFRAGGL